MTQIKKRKKTEKRKVLIIAGSRGEYGYFRPIIGEMKRTGSLDHEIVACNMHPLPAFGHSLEEMKKDGLNIGAVVYNTLDGYNRLTMVKSLGLFLMELPGIMDRAKPDFILIAGDRGEQLTAAIVGAHMYIPVAHIQAGELSGNIDGTTRHAIARFAHLHFAANEDAADRLKKSGEEDFRIFNVGAPQLDELINSPATPQKEIIRKYGLRSGQPSILVVQHSVTEEADKAEAQMAETMAALARFNWPTVIILNNSDAGSRAVRSAILKNRRPYMKIFENVPRPDYAGLMTAASVLVGNSSSGIIEAPVFKLPVVNIGNRQKGRAQSSNVINIGHDSQKIEQAIRKALSPEFRRQAESAASLYGDGGASRRIVEILQNTPVDDKLLIKRLTY